MFHLSRGYFNAISIDIKEKCGYVCHIKEIIFIAALKSILTWGQVF